MEESEYTLEDNLKWHGDVSRYSIACGSYGDVQWQVFDKNGTYVEYDEHLIIVKLYQDEIKRLKSSVEKGEECHY